MKESEPMVELTGDIFELDSLEWWSAQSKSPLYSIIKEDEKYWLKSPRFDNHTDSASLRRQAEEMLPIIQGAQLVRRVVCRTIKIGSQIKRDKQTTDAAVTLEAPNANVMLWKDNDRYYLKQAANIYESGSEPKFFTDIGIKVTELSEKIRKGKTIDGYLYKLDGCIDDPYIYQTFSYFVEEPTWLSLWNTYEMIKFDVDKDLDQTFTAKKCVMIGDGWAEPKELKSFTNTANNHLAEGKPRHSPAYALNEEERAKSPNPVKQQKHEARKKQYEKDHPPMSLLDASVLITRIFRGWCKWKAPNC